MYANEFWWKAPRSDILLFMSNAGNKQHPNDLSVTDLLLLHNVGHKYAVICLCLTDSKWYRMYDS